MDRKKEALKEANKILNPEHESYTNGNNVIFTTIIFSIFIFVFYITTQ